MEVSFKLADHEELSQLFEKERAGYPVISLAEYFAQPERVLNSLKGKHVVAFKIQETGKVAYFIKTAEVARIVFNAPRYGIAKKKHPFGVGSLTSILRFAFSVDNSPNAGTNNVTLADADHHEKFRRPLREELIKGLSDYHSRIDACIEDIISTGCSDINSFAKIIIQQTILELLGLPKDTVTMDEISKMNELACNMAQRIEGAAQEMQALRMAIDSRVCQGMKNLDYHSLFFVLQSKGYTEVACRETLFGLMIGARNGATALTHFIWQVAKDKVLQEQIRNEGRSASVACFRKSLHTHIPNAINPMFLAIKEGSEEQMFGIFPGDKIDYLISEGAKNALELSHYPFGGPNPASNLIEYIATSTVEKLVSKFDLFCNCDLKVIHNVFTNEFANEPIPIQVSNRSLNSLLNDPLFLRIKESYFDTFDIIKDYTTDFGRIFFEMPIGVFLPKDHWELQAFIQLANNYKIQIAFRAQGHSTSSSTLINGSIVVDLKRFKKYCFFDRDLIIVSANNTWKEVVDFTLKQEFTLPVLPDYLHLSVGGTLSYGGFGGASFKKGSQADHVKTLRILTFKGEMLVCSRDDNRDLFEAALSGLGQVGIILDASIQVTKSYKYAYCQEFKYYDPKIFFNHQLRLFSEEKVDHLKGYVRKENDKWVYLIETAIFADTPTGIEHAKEMLYTDFIGQVDVLVGLLEKANKWHVPHAWYSVFVPLDKIQDHLEKVLESPYLGGDEPIDIYPLRSINLQCPNLMKPEGDTFYMLSVLYGCSFVADYPGFSLVEQNMELYHTLRDQGGTRYPVDCQRPFDWKKHYASHWPKVQIAKERFDPNHLKKLI